MNWTASLWHSADDALIALARSSQALVIEAADRTVGVREGRPMASLQRLTGVKFELWYAMLNDASRLVDERYALMQSLWALHREFAQRLFDVMDPAKATRERDCEAGTASVLQFPVGRSITR